MKSIRVQGRLLSEADLDSIRQLREERPEWSRQQLSVHLAQLWQWRNGTGRLKDMAARTLLLKLQARGLIELPPPLTRNGNSRRCARESMGIQGELLAAQVEPIACGLEQLQPLALELIQSSGQRRRVSELLGRYHYRGYGGAVGENVQYLAKDGQGRELAVMVFGAAAWKVAARDQFIGWSAQQRRAHLGLIVNQQRFLILPWVQVPHLASHLLALATGGLSQQWQRRYGHRVWLVETFVETKRFTGTSYKAAGWVQVGLTTGRTRQDRWRSLQVAIKAVWVRPLHPRFREQLTKETPEHGII